MEKLKFVENEKYITATFNNPVENRNSFSAERFDVMPKIWIDTLK